MLYTRIHILLIFSKHHNIHVPHKLCDSIIRRPVMESYVEQKDLSTFKKMKLTSIEALKQAVIAGLGDFIMLNIALENAILDDSFQIVHNKNLPIITLRKLIWLKEG